MRLTIPNILSFIRLLLIPFFVLAFYLPYEWSPFATAMIFFVAGVTDWFDGYLARKLNQTTRFGAFIDPVADKVMVATALVLVVEQYHSLWITIPAITMIGREIIISALREWMAELGKRSSVAVSWVGKVKTASQMLALLLLLWHPHEWLVWLGYAALYVAMILTYWSMYIYLRAAKDDLFNAEHM
ncbi:CDP-diacylglycerol--glycerol-3-phosphate 3-phosphatidyltransferase [Photobacterium aphoticum]|uniref:CDP-diacylglycerol--glycerol-3-phosphate 3-phosphatidyltransferase n=1 Tax=Photobacterium aphoticum TaxID=754436 RepID=A0A0J1GMJ5_9GAMM|nr:CDP-diacylglycerol--glycerol-3-phosphate 3-phosphatidyltransferase [Photobacterium aphoticum]KLV00975.1 CDP-diacylglycerol--glycerol-3-phosphate 3-phosphatidyltransferase [Photobacterium aphoticum]PSU57300.1 CDP-diacylglycerol--glycerol-3-phosphate 3-phosphatidyltransferase [Photobacterium aphoticum]GHA36781.1 CDP-diacylglycerol--glycerol-3-phosphate 3-phosphatidyltransferase [Photobacterium aphoticum]